MSSQSNTVTDKTIRVHWKQFGDTEIHVYVNIIDVGDGHYFGIAFDMKVNRHLSWQNVREHVGFTVRQMFKTQTPKEIMGSLYVKVGLLKKDAVLQWSSISIRQDTCIHKAHAVHERWKKIEASKTDDLPKGWPLSDMRPFPFTYPTDGEDNETATNSEV